MKENAAFDYNSSSLQGNTHSYKSSMYYSNTEWKATIRRVSMIGEPVFIIVPNRNLVAAWFNLTKISSIWPRVELNDNNFRNIVMEFSPSLRA